MRHILLGTIVLAAVAVLILLLLATLLPPSFEAPGLSGLGEAFKNGHLAYALVCLGIEINGH